MKAKTWCGNPEAKEAEAWGLLEAVNWAAELQETNVIFELDCKYVVDAIITIPKDNAEFHSTLGLLGFILVSNYLITSLIVLMFLFLMK